MECTTRWPAGRAPEAPEASEGPGRPRKASEASEGPGGPRKAPESLGGPRKAPEGPRRPGEARKPRKTREGPEAPESLGSPGRPGKARRPGEARKPRKTREGPEGPGKPRKPRRAPGCKRPCPETGEALPGCLSGRRPASGGRRRDCRCTACGGQASPLFPTPPQAGCGQGGCGLAPVQGRLSASLKQVPGCLKGRCPATWVHERAEIAPNRAQRQRPAASGRSRGDCPRCRVKIQPQGAFFGA